MIKRKILYATILMVFPAALLVNQTSASQIAVFAPLNYANLAPSYPFAYFSWGTAVDEDSTATIDPLTGHTELYAPGLVVDRLSHSWVDTGWFQYTGPTQFGAVHADTWVSGTITLGEHATFGGSFSVTLLVAQLALGTDTPLIVWEEDEVYSSRLESSQSREILIQEVVDPGITSEFNYHSDPPLSQFMWVNNLYYRAGVIIGAYVYGGYASCQAKFNDIIAIACDSSPDPHWVSASNITQIQLSPPTGPVGTRVAVNGTWFAQLSDVYIYYDNGLVNQTVSDAYGNFQCQFTVPSNSTKGLHRVKAVDSQKHITYNFFDVFMRAVPLGNIDLTGPNGVPDGKIDVWDLYPIAKNFGKTDPNVDPPESATAQDISPSMPPVALASAIFIGLFTPREKKTKENQKTKTTQR